METYKMDFIRFMIEAGALTFGDFVTKSGRKTPYFINTGNYKTGVQARKLGAFYAEAVSSIPKPFDFLYGPAYKGIPLAVSLAIALDEKYGRDVPYCFNRKETKDHGEGGGLIGYKPNNGDSALIVEDVITAGTSVRETVPILKAFGKVEIPAMVISVDRMEVGASGRTAIVEIREEFGIETYPIVTICEIVEALEGKEIDGKILLNSDMMDKIKSYWREYCVMD
jgi:orotate phosphoribosyltransferase